jgi:hypothetical protein
MFASFLPFEPTQLYQTFAHSLGDNQPLQSLDECLVIQNNLFHLLQYDPIYDEDSSFILNYIDREAFDFSSAETLKLFIAFVHNLIAKITSRIALAKLEMQRLNNTREKELKMKSRFDPKETVVCDCGSHYTKTNKGKHFLTKKHKDYISSVMLEKEITDLKLKI